MIYTFNKDIKSLEISEQEIYRYLGYKGVEPNETVKSIINEQQKMLIGVADCKASYCEVSVAKTAEDELQIFDKTVKSHSLSVNLDKCERAFLFAATIGIGFDMRLKKLALLSTLESVVFDCIGSAAIEAFCDELNFTLEEKEKSERFFLRPRFSPGYGDLSIRYQTDILNLLDAHRKCGITLNNSLLMIPTKSVTAILGISDINKRCKSTCIGCEKIDCEFRKQEGN